MSGPSLARADRFRFGIETRYRPLGQGLATSCRTDRRVRLLRVGVGRILRNVGVWVLGCRFADGRGKVRAVVRRADLAMAVTAGLFGTCGAIMDIFDDY